MSTKYTPQSELENQAQKTIQKTGFIAETNLTFGTNYDGNPRSLVYGGTFQNRPAVFKIYNEARPVNQPENLLLFAKSHTSARMHVPELYEYALEGPQSGWMIMEFVPEQASVFQSPIQAAEREVFLQAFFEYRSHFSVAPLQPREAMDPQYTKPDGGLISSSEFHTLRLNRWRGLAVAANTQHVNDGQGSLLSDELLLTVDRVLRLIEKRFIHEPLYWCHGHFKPNEIHIDQTTGNFWITDFGHMALFPRGYEFAFMIWADALMEFDGVSYEQYRQRVIDWVADYRACGEVSRERFDRANQFPADTFPSAHKQDIKKAIQLEPEIQTAALLERLLGALYADTIGRVTIPYADKVVRVKFLHQLMNDLLDGAILSI